jgi:hypothetical protein
MDDANRLVGQLELQNEWTQQRLQEVTEELEDQKWKLTKVYQRLGQAEE